LLLYFGIWRKGDFAEAQRLGFSRRGNYPSTMAPVRHTSESVTLGHIRSQSCRDVLVYCRDVVCNHGVTLNVDHLPDDTAVRSLGARMACSKCGRVGAAVRPDWSPHTGHKRVDRPRLTEIVT
jgi:hypothetical protein